MLDISNQSLIFIENLTTTGIGFNNIISKLLYSLVYLFSGVYDDSYRSGNWMYIGENEELVVWGKLPPPTAKSMTFPFFFSGSTMILDS